MGVSQQLVVPRPKNRQPGKRRERRECRSHFVLEALSYQLQYVKNRLQLDALVLVDDLGEVITGAGHSVRLQRLASQAPWLVATRRTEMINSLSYLWESFPGIGPDQISLRKIGIKWEHGPLIVAGVGHARHLDDWVGHAAEGVYRIIQTAVH